MTVYRRGCECDHAYPLCACKEGLAGEALLRRSNRLSSLAGWPAPVGVTDAVHVIATYLRPLPASADCGCGGRA